MTKKILGRAFGASVFVALLGLAAPGSSWANDILSQRVGGAPCGACHLPNRELEGRGGLNRTGIAFMNCGERADCFQPVAARKSTQQRAGIAEFDNGNCGGRARYLNFRMGGSYPVGIIVRPGNSVLVVVSRDTTFAEACGAFPHGDASFDFVPLN